MSFWRSIRSLIRGRPSAGTPFAGDAELASASFRISIKAGDPKGFMLRDEIVTYIENYAKHIAAPVKEGVAVTRLRQERQAPADLRLKPPARAK